MQTSRYQFLRPELTMTLSWSRFNLVSLFPVAPRVALTVFFIHSSLARVMARLAKLTALVDLPVRVSMEQHRPAERIHRFLTRWLKVVQGHWTYLVVKRIPALMML